MGSNGNHHLNQLSHAYLHILQLQWTPMGSNGKLVYAAFGTIESYVFTGLLGRT